MRTPTEILKFKILTCLLTGPEAGCSVTGISKTLQQKKYAISRLMIQMGEEGLIDRSQIRAPRLTPEGRKLAEAYKKRVDIILNHFLYNGVKVEDAKEDAFRFAVNCSDATIEAIWKKDEKYRVRRLLQGPRKFTGKKLCKYLENGTYLFPFIIYRSSMDEKEAVSMANLAFEHPCTLHVENGTGTIQLRRKIVDGKTKEGKPMRGETSRLEYFDGGTYVNAEIYGDVVTFPAEILNFSNEGYGIENIIHGSVSLMVQSTVGDRNMPKSPACFVLLI